MIKKHPKIALILCIILLISFVVGIIFFVKSFTDSKSHVQYSLSQEENIIVESSDKTLEYFEDFSTISKSIDEIKPEIKNVVYANNEKIKMNNILFFSTSGNIELLCSNNKMIGYIFSTKTILSAEDTIIVLDELNKTISQKINQTTKEPVLYCNNVAVEYTDHTSLYDASNSLKTSYNFNSITINLFTEKTEKGYVVKLLVQ